MVDRPQERMEELDWRLRGHTREDYLQGRLPVRRLDVPLPEELEGVKELRATFYSLSRDIDKAMVGTTHIPNIMARVNDAIRAAQLRLADNKEEWEGALKDRLEVEQQGPGNAKIGGQEGNITPLRQSR